MSNYGFAPNFTFKELTITNHDVDNKPTDGNIIARLRHLSHKLQYLRDCVGMPLYINSAYRCPRLNARVKGSPRSHHLLGSAADISIRNLSPASRARLDRAILDSYPCEFIKYDTFWHVAYDFVHIGRKDRVSDTWEESSQDIAPRLTKANSPADCQADPNLNDDL